MNRLRELTRSTSFMSTEVAQYIQSEKFQKQLDVLEHSNTLRALLTLHLLEDVAIDPKLENGKDFLSVRDGRNTWFNIRLYSWSNFIPPFELPRGSDLERHLLKAIEDNRQGPLYAAAKKCQDYDLRIRGALARAKSLAQEAASNCGGRKSPVDYTPEEREAVEAAYQRVLDREMAPFYERGRQLEKAAAPNFSGRNWYELVGTFLFDHIKDLDVTLFSGQENDQNPTQEQSQAPSDDLNPAAIQETPRNTALSSLPSYE